MLYVFVEREDFGLVGRVVELEEVEAEVMVVDGDVEDEADAAHG